MKRSHPLIFALVLSGILWLGYGLLADWAARAAEIHLRPGIARLTLGYATDAGDFVKFRLRDAAVLLSTLALVLVLPGWLAGHLFRPAANPCRRWILPAVAAFVMANVWLAGAGHTALFWLAFWSGRDDTANLARIEIKTHLLRESRVGLKAAILGNSQAHRQISDQLLNEWFTTNLHTSELHWPGSHAYDIYLVHHNLDPAAARIVLCYVSEMNFYEDGVEDSVPLFFGFKNLPDFKKFNLAGQVPATDVGYGLLGDILPAFYLRDVVSQRLLGLGLVKVQERGQGRSGGVQPGGRDNVAAAWAQTFRLGAASAFQKAAFAAFAEECASRHQQLFIFAGQLNPRVGRRLDPALRADLMSFLHELSRRFPSLYLIENCPPQAESEYTDLTHVNAAGRAAFTRFVAAQLQVIGLTNAASPAPMDAGTRSPAAATP